MVVVRVTHTNRQGPNGDQGPRMATVRARQPRNAAPFGQKPKGKTRQDEPELYKFVCEEGQRAVDDQLSELDSMRQRSVQFLTFTGAATAFLVGTSLKTPSRTSLFYVLASTATVLMVVSVVLCLSILMASRKVTSPEPQEWRFRMSPTGLVDGIESDVPPRASDFYRWLAVEYDEMLCLNDPILSQLRRRYAVCLGTGFLQLTLWLLIAWIFA